MMFIPDAFEFFESLVTPSDGSSRVTLNYHLVYTDTDDIGDELSFTSCARIEKCYNA